jgi:precorrin-3B methylase
MWTEVSFVTLGFQLTTKANKMFRTANKICAFRFYHTFISSCGQDKQTVAHAVTNWLFQEVTLAYN